MALSGGKGTLDCSQGGRLLSSAPGCSSCKKQRARRRQGSHPQWFGLRGHHGQVSAWQRSLLWVLGARGSLCAADTHWLLLGLEEQKCHEISCFCQVVAVWKWHLWNSAAVCDAESQGLPQGCPSFPLVPAANIIFPPLLFEEGFSPADAFYSFGWTFVDVCAELSITPLMPSLYWFGIAKWDAQCGVELGCRQDTDGSWFGWLYLGTSVVDTPNQAGFPSCGAAGMLETCHFPRTATVISNWKHHKAWVCSLRVPEVQLIFKAYRTSFTCLDALASLKLFLDKPAWECVSPKLGPAHIATHRARKCLMEIMSLPHQFLDSLLMLFIPSCCLRELMGWLN